jgi:hypothetical protein
MAFNIRDFSVNIGKYGTAPVNRFEVRIPVPQSLRGFYGSEEERVLTLRAERVNIPGIVLDSFETRRYGVGPSIKTPVGKSRFNEVSIDFIDTSKLDIKSFFYDWMNDIVEISGNPTPTFLAGYKENYSIDMLINVYNSTNTSPIFVLKLVQAFPTAMSDSNMAWSRTNELFKTSVVFSYKNHQPVTGTVEVETPAPATTETVVE